ncbi:MAG TPA: POTRA domain-containing protein, partial [Anaeromyxobacteraceae bacterium]|nr:POTRA domain-containing protein [Anaeromyxobacteraceae bacterium]
MPGALGLALLVALAAGAPPDRPRVAAVRLELPAGEAEGSLPALVAVRPGEPLSPRDVRLTVQRLFSTGRCGAVVARSEPAGDGAVEVVFACPARRVVASVRVEGAPAPLDAERVRRAAALEAGAELWPGRLEEAAERVQAAYARRGWRSARVEARAEGQPGAEVTLAVTPGAPTRVQSVEVVGARRAGTAASLSIRPGDVLDLDAVDDDLRGLRGRLRAAGWLRARVADPELRIAGERATLRVAVEPGPRVAVRFAGARAFPAAELSERLALASEPSLDATALAAAATRLRGFYRSQGFADARVEADEVAVPGGALVEVRIREGRRYRVRAVTFAGAVARSPAWLRARLDEALDALAPPPTGDPGEAERLA